MTMIKDLITDTGEERARQQLEFMLSTAEAKVALLKQDIVDLYVNPASQGKIQILPSVEVAYYDEYRADIKEGVSDTIKEIIGQFFQMDTEGLKNGFAKLIEVGLSTILGDSQTSESTKHWFVIAPEGLSIIRTDVGVWRYNFQSEGVVASAKNAFAFVFSKALVDIEKLKKAEIVYFIQQMVGSSDIKVVKDYLERLEEIYDLTGGRAQPEHVTQFVGQEQKRMAAHRRLRATERARRGIHTAAAAQ